MITQLRLKNFKNWRDLTLDLANVNVLFGANSSGKSAILQSLLLLKQTFPSPMTLNFGNNQSDYTYADLGDYRELIFQHHTSNQLTVGLTVDTAFLEPSSTNNNVSYDIQWQFENQILERHIATTGQTAALIAEQELNHIAATIHYISALRRPLPRSIKFTGYPVKQVGRYGEFTFDVLATIAARAYQEPESDAIMPITLIGRWLSKMGIANNFGFGFRNPQELEATITPWGSTTPSAMIDVGVGIGQVLPVLTMLFTVPEGSIVLLEHPEIHLHPAAQFALADLCLHVAQTRNLQLIIETHSEHFLMRIQRRIAEKGDPNTTEGQIAQYANDFEQHIRLYFCENTPDGAIAKPIEVNRFGQIQNWPSNFFGDVSGEATAISKSGLQKRRQELESASEMGD